MGKFSKEENLKRHAAAAHAMQTGVAFEMNHDPAETQPKHLRVGVNSALSDLHGLARLLVAKGVISEDEYLEAIADAMVEEAERYSKRINERMGADGRVHLH